MFAYDRNSGADKNFDDVGEDYAGEVECDDDAGDVVFVQGEVDVEGGF